MFGHTIGRSIGLGYVAARRRAGDRRSGSTAAGTSWRSRPSGSPRRRRSGHRTTRRTRASGRDRSGACRRHAADARPGRHRRRRRDRREHRLPPHEARLARRRPARAPPAHRRAPPGTRRGSSPRPAWRTETLLWMARYTRDLCVSLEAETGQATGFRPIGHLHLATTPRAPRDAPARGGLRPRLRRRQPGALGRRVRQAVAGRRRPTTSSRAFYVADEGRVNPADLTMAYAKGARMGGARIVEGVAGHRLHARRRAASPASSPTAGTIERGVRRATPPGCGAAQVGALAGVSVPLQAAEHYYLITDTVDWAHPDLPVVEDPDRYGYYREEGGGILVGLFEPVGRAVVARPASRRTSRSPACRRTGTASGRTSTRRWTASRAPRGRHPDDVLRPRELHAGPRPAARRGAGARRLLRRGRAELARHPAQRRRRQPHRRSGSSTASRRST